MEFETLAAFAGALAGHRPRRGWGTRVARRAAVAVVARFSPRSGVELLFVVRAAKGRDPWSGHTAFPGGMVEVGEAPLDAAIRETREECAIDLSTEAAFVAELDSIPSLTHSRRRLMLIQVFLFVADGPLELEPNHEVAATVWVPLAELADRGHRHKLHKRILGLPLRFDAFEKDGVVIWGLTWKMVRDLLRACTAENAASATRRRS